MSYSSRKRVREMVCSYTYIKEGESKRRRMAGAVFTLLFLAIVALR